jgi:uncharacterized protein YqeY
MSLRKQIEKDFTDALRARDERRLSALRLFKTDLKKREVSGQKRETTDAEAVEVLSTLVKQRRESIRFFQEGRRQDLIEKEEAELQILLAYLPQPLSPPELEALIDQAVAENQATGPKDQGKIMKGVMGKVAGRADGKAVSEIVKQKLAKMAG